MLIEAVSLRAIRIARVIVCRRRTMCPAKLRAARARDRVSTVIDDALELARVLRTPLTMRTILALSTLLVALAASVACGSTSNGTDVADASHDGGVHEGGNDGSSNDGSTNGDASDASTDAPQDCGYPNVTNDSRCPATWQALRQESAAQHACSPIGLTCAYPGQGDGTSNGCYSTAMGWCRGDAGDAGDGEAGTGSWLLAQ